jgi:DNA-binding PadR family transcriptional regulator
MLVGVYSCTSKEVPTRKVDNLLGLAVLATVQERPMHRYEMATVIRERGKDRDMAVKWGSLYTVVQNLTRHGFLEIAGNERHGNRPERTIYTITASGRAELRDWARELISTPQEDPTLFVAGLSVLAALAPDDAIDLLQQRADALRELIAQRRSELTRDAASVQRLFLVEDEYRLALFEAEARWAAELLEELTTKTFPGLADWRHFHQDTDVREGSSATAGRS